jgi:transposase
MLEHLLEVIEFLADVFFSFFCRNIDSLSNIEENRFALLSEMNLKTARAYRMKEAIKVIWDCPDIATETEVFKNWHFWATHSRLEPFVKLARTLKKHKTGILNNVRNRISDGTVEAINKKDPNAKEKWTWVS